MRKDWSKPSESRSYNEVDRWARRADLRQVYRERRAASILALQTLRRECGGRYAPGQHEKIAPGTPVQTRHSATQLRWLVWVV